MPAKNRIASNMIPSHTRVVATTMKTEAMPPEWKYMSYYHSAGIMSVFSAWLESDFAFPKEKLLKLIADIDLACDNLYDEYV